MCRRHWSALKPTTQQAVWREYRPGQETDKRPSLRYLAVHMWAVGELAFKPHDERAAALCGAWIIRAEIARAEAIEAGQGDPLKFIGKPPAFTIDQARELERQRLAAIARASARLS